MGKLKNLKEEKNCNELKNEEEVNLFHRKIRSVDHGKFDLNKKMVKSKKLKNVNKRSKTPNEIRISTVNGGAGPHKRKLRASQFSKKEGKGKNEKLSSSYYQKIQGNLEMPKNLSKSIRSLKILREEGSLTRRAPNFGGNADAEGQAELELSKSVRVGCYDKRKIDEKIEKTKGKIGNKNSKGRNWNREKSAKMLKGKKTQGVKESARRVSSSQEKIFLNHTERSKISKNLQSDAFGNSFTNRRPTLAAYSKRSNQSSRAKFKSASPNKISKLENSNFQKKQRKTIKYKFSTKRQLYSPKTRITDLKKSPQRKRPETKNSNKAPNPLVNSKRLKKRKPSIIDFLRKKSLAKGDLTDFIEMNLNNKKPKKKRVKKRIKIADEQIRTDRPNHENSTFRNLSKYQGSIRKAKIYKKLLTKF
jgi:hypothetical protein